MQSYGTCIQYKAVFQFIGQIIFDKNDSMKYCTNYVLMVRRMAFKRVVGWLEYRWYINVGLASLHSAVNDCSRLYGTFAIDKILD